MLLSTLVVFGFMNFCFGQFNAVNESISIQTFDANGLAEQVKLEGHEALSFDIPAYIKDNQDAKRLIISGYLKGDVSTTFIKFDSDKAQADNGEELCKQVKTTLKPFIGTKVSGRDDLNGVNIEKIIHAAPADIVGITTSDIITDFNGVEINSYCDLIMAVGDTEIGDEVALILKKGYKQYTKHLTIGASQVHNVTYNYCEEIPVVQPSFNQFKINNDAASLTSYPNPTRSMTHINFTSGSDEEVSFYVIDALGNLIHKEYFSDFNGHLRLDYNFDNQSSGHYIFAIQQGKEIHKRKVQVVRH